MNALRHYNASEKFLHRNGYHVANWDDCRRHASVEKQLLADYPDMAEWASQAAQTRATAILEALREAAAVLESAPEPEAIPIPRCRPTLTNAERAVAVAKQVRRQERKEERKLLRLPFQQMVNVVFARMAARVNYQREI